MGLSEAPATGAQLKDLTPSQCLRLSNLLDESIELAGEERAAWLDSLNLEDPGWAAFLRGMFASQDGGAQKILETKGFLASHLPETEDRDAALIGKHYGPYRIMSLLGHGGMGSVWLAERVDGLFTRKVALKLVHPALVSRVLMERSAREREILAGLNHPNIARLIDAGFAQDGQPYLALEYVAGVPLTSFCDARRLPIRERVQLFRQVLSAVQYAHAHLVIHRDLKPSNIMVTADGQAYLLDFGIAKLLTEGEAKETELTRLGGRALTPDYAAPEQIAGAPITTAADVYALGVVLYELLTGVRPYRLKRDTRGALEEAILHADPVAPSRATISENAATARGTTATVLSKLVDSDLDTIVIKALKKFSAERYATVNAFDEDIARYLRGDVVLAQRDSLSYRARKFARRYRVAIGVAGALLLTLAAGLAATGYEAKIASRQRDAALAARTRALTQTAAARLKDSDVSGAIAILMALPADRDGSSLDAAALNVFQEARAADAQLFTLTGHTGSIRTAVYSPDGQRIVTAAADSTARIWDAVAGRELMVLHGHTQKVRSAVFSPDGREVLTVSYDDTARTWDAASGRQLALLRGGRHNRMHFASYSPDGRRIVIASGDGTAQIWDASFDKQLADLSGHAEITARAVFSPDGTRVATASFDKTASIWDAASGREITLLKGHTGGVWSVAFSPDGGRVVTGSFDDTARIWDAFTGRQVMVLSGHNNVVSSAEFSPDGLRVVTSSEDKTARIWDASTGRQMALLNGHSDLLETASFSPDGHRIVAAGEDGTARIWDLQSSSQVLALTQHSDLVGSAEFSRDGGRILTSSWDGSIRAWQADTGRQVLMLDPHAGHVNFATLSPDSSRIAAAYAGIVSIWDSASHQETNKSSGHTERVETVDFSPDGTRIVSSSWDKTARVWDAATGRQQLVLRGHTAEVDSAVFSPDGRRIATASYDKTARIWDAATGTQVAILAGHAQRVSSVAFAPDGRRIVTASNDRTVRIWNALSGEEIMVLSGDEDGVEMAAFSPDGKRIVTASYDRTARIWDAATGEQLKVLSGHTDEVETAVFSPDGQRVVTASDDQTARVWDARTVALGTQFAWAEAAQFDPLLNSERFELGLPAESNVHRWSGHISKCDESAAAPYDPDRIAPGVMPREIVADIAVAACADAIEHAENTGRSLYQRGRALSASGKFVPARRDFEAAKAAGYRAAGAELAMLLSNPLAGMVDAPAALSLFGQAWNDGVTIAAFRLGYLYEHGLAAPDGKSSLLPADEVRAWAWYRKGADAGEPNSLARIAERNDVQKSRLEAFVYYAAAAERARSENWPDTAWRDWRFRRASLARLLEHEGRMQAVADEYAKVRVRYLRKPTLWRRFMAAN
jgi:WD40 repeat protein/serine/threonine protein kinase